MGVIYCICFPNGKRYVGQTTQPIDVRIGQHKRSNKCPLLHRAMKKYPKFDVEILLETNDSMLDHYETLFIHTFNTIKPGGYNLSSGGGTGRKHSDYSRKKMSESHKGVSLSEHHRQRLSESHQGIVFTQERRQNISTAKTGKTRPDEFKKLMSQKSRKDGFDLPMYVYKVEGGYKVRPPDKKDKLFTSKTLTNDEKLKQALQFLESKMMVSND